MSNVIQFHDAQRQHQVNNRVLLCRDLWQRLGHLYPEGAKPEFFEAILGAFNEPHRVRQALRERGEAVDFECPV